MWQLGRVITSPRACEKVYGKKGESFITFEGSRNVTESSQFNVFHQFAGCFVPHGLLSIKNLSAGAKVCYAVLAQQANARSAAQLNLPLLAASIGESERIAVRYLIE